MGNKKNKHIGKIGWCDSHVLGLQRGHFVYIRNVKNVKCDVNTFSSIEDRNGSIEIAKVNFIKDGQLYPIPKKDCNLPRFSGVDNRVIRNISIHDIKYKRNYSIKNRHKHYINKYVK